MANPSHETGETSPLNTPGYKALRHTVIILGVLLVVGLGVIITTIIYRATNLAGESDVAVTRSEVPTVTGSVAAVSFGEISVAQPQGATLVGFEVEAGVIYLHFASESGEAIIQAVRLSDGERLGSVRSSHVD
jgi:hypothetical protein